jgi:hypothetical protein
MAGKEEEEKPKAVDKGKGKAVDTGDASKDGEKKDDQQDAKAQQNGVLPPGRRSSHAAYTIGG